MYHPDLILAYYCPHCSSSLVVHQSWSQWNVYTQSFEPVRISTKAMCLSCEATFNYVVPTEMTEEVIMQNHCTTTPVKEAA